MVKKTCAAKLNDRGRVTIDVDVRRELNLEKGDYVELVVKPLGESNE